MLTLHPLELSGVAQVYNYSNLKTLSPKQMPQILPIALAQIKMINRNY